MMHDILVLLAEPFEPSAISWRIGMLTKDKSKGKALAYIDARDVERRLDEVMGADWQCEYVPMNNGTHCCRIGLFLDGEWRWRANGAGDTDIEGQKGGYSDAFKRAAVKWGIGRYLYGIDAPWVRIDEWKKIAPDEMNRLSDLLRQKDRPTRVDQPSPRKSANSLKKDGSWSKAMDALRVAIDLGEDAVFAANRSLEAVVQTWPPTWQEQYKEALERALERTRGMAA